MWYGQSGPHINPDLIRDYTAEFLHPMRRGGAMKFVDFLRMIGSGREYGETHLVKLGLAIRWVGNTRIVDRNEAAAWLNGHNGRAWLDGRLRRGRLTVEQYNAVVDFVKEYG
jgi:hypothetical protein